MFHLEIGYRWLGRIIRDHHFGEGRYEQSERVIQRLLGVERELASVEGLGVEAEADCDHLRTLKAYLGYRRSAHLASPDGAAFHEQGAYELPREPAVQLLSPRLRVDDRA